MAVFIWKINRMLGVSSFVKNFEYAIALCIGEAMLNGTYSYAFPENRESIGVVCHKSKTKMKEAIVEKFQPTEGTPQRQQNWSRTGSLSVWLCLRGKMGSGHHCPWEPASRSAPTRSYPWRI